MTGPAMIVAIVAIFTAGWVAVTLLKGFFKWLNKEEPAGSVQEGSNVTMSELEALIQRAVREAVRPLEQQVERLEHKIDAPPRLPEPPEADARFGLIAEEESDLPEHDSSTRRERVR